MTTTTTGTVRRTATTPKVDRELLQDSWSNLYGKGQIDQLKPGDGLVLTYGLNKVCIGRKKDGVYYIQHDWLVPEGYSDDPGSVSGSLWPGRSCVGYCMTGERREIEDRIGFDATAARLARQAQRERERAEREREEHDRRIEDLLNTTGEVVCTDDGARYAPHASKTEAIFRLGVAPLGEELQGHERKLTRVRLQEYIVGRRPMGDDPGDMTTVEDGRTGWAFWAGYWALFIPDADAGPATNRRTKVDPVDRRKDYTIVDPAGGEHRVRVLNMGDGVVRVAAAIEIEGQYKVTAADGEEFLFLAKRRSATRWVYSVI